MAIVSVTKTFGDEASRDENGFVIRDYYLVHAEVGDVPAISFGAVDPSTSLTIPSYNQACTVTGFTTLRVANVGVTRASDPRTPQFKVEVEYRANTNGTPVSTGKWNVRVSSSGIEVVERVNKDVDGNAIYNAVGDLYQADIELVLYDEIITVAYDTKESDGLEDMGRARGLVNDSPITLTIVRYGRTWTRTFPTKTLKLGNATWDIDLGSDGDGKYNVSIPLIARHQLDSDGNEIGWKVQVPDRGARFYPSTSSSVPVISNSGVVDLADDGTKLAAGDPQHMIVVDLIPTANFSSFLP